MLLGEKTLSLITHGTRMSTSTSVAAVLLVAGLTAVVPTPSQAGVRPLCQGKVATVVGQPGRSLRATPRADVVVTNGASAVDTGAGPDLICVTGSFQLGQTVDAGRGNDRVVNKSGRAAEVNLSVGRDVFIGGTADESVVAQDYVVKKPGDDQGDRILTGGGSDQVVMTYNGRANHYVDGGPGSDYIAAYAAEGSLRRVLVVDNKHKVMHLADSRQRVPMRGFDRFETGGRGITRFIGGDRAEQLMVNYATAGVNMNGSSYLRWGQ